MGHKQQTILIKIISMDESELLINGIKEGSNKVHTLEIALSDHIHLENASKSLKEYKAIYKDIDATLILVNEQITNKLIKQQKDNDDKKKKKKKEKDSNPLIIPDMNPQPNPLLIGGGRGRGIAPPFGGGFGGDLDPFGGGGGN